MTISTSPTSTSRRRNGKPLDPRIEEFLNALAPLVAAAKQKKEAPTAYAPCYDCSTWHGQCAGVVALTSHASGKGIVLYCPSCRCVADMEAVSGKMSAEESFTVRHRDG